MTTRNTQDLANAVMQRLGLIDPNKQPTARELALIADRYEEKLAELVPSERVYWEDDAIPLAVFGAMTRIIAEEVAPTFGAPIPAEQDDDGQTVSIGNRGLRMLNRHLAKQASGVPTKATYF